LPARRGLAADMKLVEMMRHRHALANRPIGGSRRKILSSFRF
jgi:hypothetical protein